MSIGGEQESQTKTLSQRVANQREEIRRLQKCLNDTKQSRDYWKAEAGRIGKQLNRVLKERRKEDGEIH